MNTLVPLEYYNVIYHYFILLIVIIAFFKGKGSKLESYQNLKTSNLFGLFLFVIILLYMGLRPISYQFGDMGSYAKRFKEFQEGAVPVFQKDVLYEYLMFTFSKFSSPEFFFLFCAVLYIVPLYFFSKKVFDKYWFYSFLILAASFSFWAYGTNGIRNGISTSIFLWAISFKSNAKKIALFFAAASIHQSMYLPIGAYILTSYYKNSKSYFWGWIIAIPISLILGSALENFFLNIGFAPKEDIQGYLGEFDQGSENVVLKTGFRWDFLLYSGSAVFAAWFYLFKKQYKDLFYRQLVNIYLTTNAFWILVIRANYSNRFAYLSWFMMGVVIIYPVLKVKVFEKQNQKIGIIILVYCLFSYILNVLLAQ
jgi:hypothetical protein